MAQAMKDGVMAMLRQPLNQRIAVLGLSALLFLILSLPGRGLYVGFDHDQPAGFVLMPVTVPGQWKPGARWIYPEGALMNQQHQEYGVWERDGVRVVLSYDHHSAEHNALNCFVGMGQVVESILPLRLPTADGAVTFNMARLRDGEVDKVAAVTSCRPAGCQAYPPAPAWRDLLRASYWQAWWRKPDRAREGIAVNLHAEAISPAPSLGEAALQAALADFIAVLDLAPARARGDRI